MEKNVTAEALVWRELTLPQCHPIRGPHYLLISPRACLHVSVSVCLCTCMSRHPLLLASFAPCSVLPLRKGASRLFEVSLQLQGLTPQVSAWLFTQSRCNSAGKPCFGHEYKAGLQSNGVSFTSTLILSWPASDRVIRCDRRCTEPCKDARTLKHCKPWIQKVQELLLPSFYTIFWCFCVCHDGYRIHLTTRKASWLVLSAWLAL